MERLLLVAAQPWGTSRWARSRSMPRSGRPRRSSGRRSPRPGGPRRTRLSDVMASVTEQVAFFGAKTVESKPRKVAADLDPQTYLNVLRALDGVIGRKRTPPLPSRTPLVAVGPDGKVVELPPLPDDFVAEAEAVDGSSGPPSPRRRRGSRGRRRDRPTRRSPARRSISTAARPWPRAGRRSCGFRSARDWRDPARSAGCRRREAGVNNSSVPCALCVVP